jgi:integrase
LQAFQQAQLQAGLAASTINSHIDDLLASLRDLAQQDQPIDPALFRLRYLPRPQSLPRHLSDIQSQSLERYLHARLTQADPLVRLENACFFILAHTGLRASECLDLLGQDLDLAGQRLIVRQGKGQRDRVVYLSSSACQALQAYLADMPLQPTLPLLRLPSGQPISYSWLYTHLTQVGQAAGQIKVTPHQLRHTLATRLLNVGMPVTAIQKLLGHDNLNTTMIYARVLEETVQAEYQRAMNQIEGQQMPFSRTPELVPGWPVPQPLEPSPTQVDNFA